MTKRFRLLLLSLITFAAQGMAQTIQIEMDNGSDSKTFDFEVPYASFDITTKDYSGATFRVEDVKDIVFYNQGPEGSLSGRWYLGYRVGTSTTAIKGKENWVFRGTKMVQNASSSQKTYALEYEEDGVTFKATQLGSSTSSTYTIIAREPELLVLKRSTYMYYLYPDLATAQTAEKEDFPVRAPLTDAAKIISQYGSGRSNNASNPMGNHIAGRAKRATAEQKEWLEDATKNPAKMCGFTNWQSKTVTLYPYTNPVPADVNQHAIGDCCFCAVLASFAYHAPDFIKDIITKESTTSYAVKMYDPYGDPITVRVDNKILMTDGGGIAQMTGKNDKITWATILEKAMFKWESVYKVNSSNGDDIGGIGTENASPQFTGNGNSFAIDRKKLFNSEMKKVVEWCVENGHVGIGGFGVGDLQCGTERSVTGHAFTLMLTSYPDKYLWTMRNPWGQSSTGTKVDGQLEIPDTRSIVKTIDFRIVEPGAMAAFIRKDKTPYTPPTYIRRQTDTGVSKEILRQCGVTRFLDYIDDEEEPVPSFDIEDED